jgi:hypothetical protein
MQGKLSQDDEATAPFCPLLIIINVPLMNLAMDGKVGGMGRKTDSIGNFYLINSERGEKKLKHGKSLNH